MSLSNTFAFFGFGDFNSWFYEHLCQHVPVAVYDPREDMNKIIDQIPSHLPKPTRLSFEEAAKLPFNQIGVPLPAMERTIAQLGKEKEKNIARDHVVYDVGSVNMLTERLFREHMPPSINTVTTHPLFGPKSGADGTEGLKIAMTPIQCTDAHYQYLTSLMSDKLKLKVIETTSEHHDKLMARQALTHHIGRTIGELGWGQEELETVSAEILRSISDMVKDDSDELFNSIIAYNPHAMQLISEFMAESSRLYAQALKLQTQQRLSPNAPPPAPVGI